MNKEDIEDKKVKKTKPHKFSKKQKPKKTENEKIAVVSVEWFPKPFML